MNAVKVDSAHRIRLKVLKPGDFYEPEIGPQAELVTLRRRQSPRTLTKPEVIRRIENSKLIFKRDWEEIRQDTREP